MQRLIASGSRSTVSGLVSSPVSTQLGSNHNVSYRVPATYLCTSSSNKRFLPVLTRRDNNSWTWRVRSVSGETLSDEDDDLCPVECVREFKTDEELQRVIEKAKEDGSLVVVDFYRTSCGSCKYIEKGFSKLCKGSGDQGASVVFLKHNVIDEYDEQSEVADRLRIKTVPLFHFYKDGALVEAFATRDKERIDEAILKIAEGGSSCDACEHTFPCLLYRLLIQHRLTLLQRIRNKEIKVQAR